MKKILSALILSTGLSGCLNTSFDANNLPTYEPIKITSDVPAVQEEKKVPLAQPCKQTTTEFGEYKAVLNAGGDDFKDVIYEIDRFGECTLYLDHKNTLIIDNDCNGQVDRVLSFGLYKEFHLDDLRRWNLEQPLNWMLSESGKYACRENLLKPESIDGLEKNLQQYY